MDNTVELLKVTRHFSCSQIFPEWFTQSISLQFPSTECTITMTLYTNCHVADSKLGQVTLRCAYKLQFSQWHKLVVQWQKLIWIFWNQNCVRKLFKAY